MNVQSYQALRDGIMGYFHGRRAHEDRAEEKAVRDAMLKRQLERDAAADEQAAFDREVKKKQIELAANADRRAHTKLIDENLRGAAEDVERAIEQARRASESGARVDLLKAQTQATLAKPTVPPSPEETKMQGWMRMREAALTQLKQAQQSGDPAALAVAQEDYQFVQQMRQNWLKEQKEPLVQLEFPGEDGVSKMKLAVPQSQWNEQHPMWAKFAGGGGGAAAPMTQQQVLEAVRAGKMSKEEAAAYAQKQGWR
jgi:hypothetical protein